MNASHFYDLIINLWASKSFSTLTSKEHVPRQWAAAAARQGAALGVKTDIETGSSQYIADEDDLSEGVWGVWAALVRKLWHQPIITLFTINKESESDAVEPPRWHQKPLKSCKLHTAHSMVFKKGHLVSWVGIHGQGPACHVWRSVCYTLFVRIPSHHKDSKMVKPSLKLIMAKHFNDLMADTEVYEWASVRAYHAIWLQ